LVGKYPILLRRWEELKVILSPKTLTSPAVGFISPNSSLIVVVFPAPLGPRNPVDGAFLNLQVHVINCDELRLNIFVRFIVSIT